jgi:malonate decarboxylase beta subunit
VPRISFLDPLARLAALADAGSLAPFTPAGASPHLTRWGIVPAVDDGVVCARLSVGSARVVAMAQDARFLGGSVGARHGTALRRMLQSALAERVDAVVLLLDSGGVRLHEANAAELALAQALQALFDLRRAGIPTLAVVTGVAYGGASVLAAACDQLLFLPDAQFGLSGARVIETTRGKAELDAADRHAVATLFGASARVAHGIGVIVEDDSGALRDLIRAAAQAPVHFDEAALQHREESLAARLAAAGVVPVSCGHAQPEPTIFADADAVDPLGWLWRVRDSDVHLLRPLAPHAYDPAVAVAIARALAHHLPARAPLVVVEDSPGHATTRMAETLGVSEYLATHAARLALLRMEEHVVLGLLAGRGHSASFFVNALQATTLDALPGARVEAMAVDAIARVTRLPAEALAAMIENDPVLGQPARHLAAWGGIARMHTHLTTSALLSRVAELRDARGT